jgi:glycosyltransferase involved in cell wall biosynthesis
MIHLFINALAASAGGGVTYIRNFVLQLAQRADVRGTVLANSLVREQLPSAQNLDYPELRSRSATPLRFWFEQSQVSELIRRSGADVLLSAGNFALRNAPVPQILLSRNSLYTSSDFYRDLVSRRHFGIWVDTKLKAILAKQSVQWADCTVAPSRAFADELEAWTGRKVVAIHHGFDRESFLSGESTLGPTIQQQLDRYTGALRLLFVSHYNYYRNFETLLRAIPGIQQTLGSHRVKLFLTCKLSSRENPGSYRAEAAAALMKRLNIEDSVIELGSVPYGALHHVYRACDLYVTPAYTETFAHPLVEAMSCGLPVVASDLPVHREICGDAALYFERFSESALTEAVCQIATTPALRRQLSERALKRANAFSWKEHTSQIVALAQSLLGRTRSAAA